MTKFILATTGRFLLESSPVGEGDFVYSCGFCGFVVPGASVPIPGTAVPWAPGCLSLIWIAASYFGMERLRALLWKGN